MLKTISLSLLAPSHCPAASFKGESFNPTQSQYNKYVIALLFRRIYKNIIIEFLELNNNI